MASFQGIPEETFQSPQKSSSSNKKQKVPLDEKIEFISNQLKNNFPFKRVIIIGIIMILIGFAAIGLQVLLIINKALYYEIGNGIWGGCLAIVSGLLKINLGN